MANTSSGDTQAGDKPANTSLLTEVRSYLLKVKSIENTKTLNLLKHTKQMMQTLQTRIVMKNKNINGLQMMNKMTKTMQKISQKISNITKKNFAEMTYNFNVAFACGSQKIVKLKQTLNVKTTTIRINSDADKKMFVEKSTYNLIN